MDIKAYIASGILELYVSGSLSEKENAEVYEVLKKHPEAMAEVERIEKSLQQLSGALAPNRSDTIFSQIQSNIQEDQKQVIPVTRKRSSLPTYIAWAASIALLVGLFTQLNKNKTLKQQLVKNQTEQQLLEGKLKVAEEDLTTTKNILSVLRNKDILQVPLPGQKIDPTAYAAVYWDKDSEKVYIDVAGLPTPPPGKVYQVWSLKLNPLTPTSLGILDQFDDNKNKIFLLKNQNESEAFGITLEPEGGSTFPTLEMLYTLGTIES